MSLKEIVRQLRVSRNTVREVIKQQGKVPPSTRRDKIRIDAELLVRLHQRCDGFVQRIHEILAEEEGIQIKYSTLTRMLRCLGIGKTKEKRCDRVPDVPGAEFQHDTSPHEIKLAGIANRLIASLMSELLTYPSKTYDNASNFGHGADLKLSAFSGFQFLGSPPLLRLNSYRKGGVRKERSRRLYWESISTNLSD